MNAVEDSNKFEDSIRNEERVNLTFYSYENSLICRNHITRL